MEHCDYLAHLTDRQQVTIVLTTRPVIVKVCSRVSYWSTLGYLVSDWLASKLTQINCDDGFL